MSSFQIPPGKRHRFRVWIDGHQQSWLIWQVSAYCAREAVAVMRGVSPSRVRTLLFDGGDGG